MDVIDAAHKTVHDTKHGGSIALAARMGMSSTVLNNKVNPNTDSHHLRLDEAVTIMEYTGDTSIIQAMAQRLGGVFAPVSAAGGQDDLLMTVIGTSVNQGDVAALLQAALADNRIDRSECNALQDAIQKAMSALQHLANQVNNHCKEPK